MSTPWYRGLRLVYRIPGLADGMRVEEEEPYGLKNELVRSIVKAERGENFLTAGAPVCVREVDLRGWAHGVRPGRHRLSDADHARTRTS